MSQPGDPDMTMPTQVSGFRRHRVRIALGVVGFAIGAILAFMMGDYLIAAMSDMVCQAMRDNGVGCSFITTSAVDRFFLLVSFTMWGGMFTTWFVVSFALWKFTFTNLAQDEARALLPVDLAASVAFLVGGAIAIFGIIPSIATVVVGFFMPNMRALTGLEGGMMGSMMLQDNLGFALGTIAISALALQLPLLIWNWRRARTMSQLASNPF